MSLWESVGLTISFLIFSVVTVKRPVSFVIAVIVDERTNRQNGVSKTSASPPFYSVSCHFVKVFYKNSTFFMAYVTCSFTLICLTHTLILTSTTCTQPHTYTKRDKMYRYTRRPCTDKTQAYTHMQDLSAHTFTHSHTKVSQSIDCIKDIHVAIMTLAVDLLMS